MTSPLPLIVAVMALSILVQGVTAIMAMRLIQITGRKLAWSLIALALLLMAVRRTVPVVRMLSSDDAHPPDPANEYIALAISFCLMIGISRIAPLFRERIETERRLREKTEELDRYFTNALDLLCIADTAGFFRRLNPQWEIALGYSVDELVGRRFMDFVHPDDIAATRQALATLGQQKEVLGFTNRYRHKDGAYRWIEWRSYPAGTRVYAVARDITDRKRAEAEIRQLNEELDRRVKERTAQLEIANKELESFSYSVSHDLRAPLRRMDGFSRILLEDYSEKLDDAGRDALHRIRAASQRMGHLIDDLLQISRHSRCAMNCTAVDLSALAGHVVEELQRTAPERQVEFVIAPALIVHADAPLMRAVLENLLGNAWKFTAKQPAARIEFGVVTRRQQRTFFVRDNGAGFDLASAGKLFGIFQRFHDDNEFPGTGIGLNTVQRIIHRHGGTIEAEAAPGQGATFYFTIA